MEYAVYAKSDAPKFTPSKTKAKQLIGWVAAINCSRKPKIRVKNELKKSKHKK